MEQSTINQRLNFIVDKFENGKKASFARKAGISPQGAQELLAGRKGDPSFKVLLKILESYPQVQTEWLVLGRGEMLNKEVPNESLPMTNMETTPQALSDARYSEEHKNIIELVNKNSEEVGELRNALAGFVNHLMGSQTIFEKGGRVDQVLKDLPEELLRIFRQGNIRGAKPLKRTGESKSSKKDKKSE